jgi:hypothetical protein
MMMGRVLTSNELMNLDGNDERKPRNGRESFERSYLTGISIYLLAGEIV